jgi:hypothetical protein
MAQVLEDTSSFDTLRTWRIALSNLSNSVLSGREVGRWQWYMFSLSKSNNSIWCGFPRLDSGFVLTQERNRVMRFFAMPG